MASSKKVAAGRTSASHKSAPAVQKGAQPAKASGTKSAAKKPAASKQPRNMPLTKNAAAKKQSGVGKGRPGKKGPISPLAASLQALPASGERGFEGLVERLLTKLTGTQFLVRRSGSQAGRDIDSDSVFVECKRYEESTELDERMLRTQVSISLAAAPKLDMWVLATTRSVDANVSEWLEGATNELGLDFHILSCGTVSHPRDLDYLCAEFERDVLEFLKPSRTSLSGVRGFLATLRSEPVFATAVDRIRGAFLRATVGLPTFRKRLNEALLTTLKDETLSRTRLNSPLTSGQSAPLNVPRDAVSASLQDFYAAQRDANSPRLIVVRGDEGNGKSWAVASWVRNLIASKNAPPVFWFKSSACKEEGLRDLAQLAFDQLQPGSETLFQPKLQRWLGLDGSSTAIVVLDGVNERHSFTFWTNYILHLLGETNSNVLVIVTCRPETWDYELRPSLQRPAMVIDVNEFDSDEFAIAMRGQPRDTVDRLWQLGPVARKPRYLADALAYLQDGGDVDVLTVEMLQFEAWKKRLRTRSDFPLGTRDLEEVLKFLAARMSARVSAGELTDLLAFTPSAVDGLRDLATGGVLMKGPGNSMTLHRPFLVEGLSLLLVELLTNAAGTLPELRQQIGEFVHDTQRSPLTAEVCAAAAFKALADGSIRDDVAVALTLEFLNCQNAEPTSIEGVIALAAKRPQVIASLAEALWSVRGVDSTNEQLVLHGLGQLAKAATAASPIVQILTRWASFVHEDGEFQRREGGAAERAQAGVLAVAPQLGRVQLSSDGLFVVTRVENQRHLRLARLALAVISLADRRVFFQAVLNTLVADALMGTSRAGISAWVLASSRSPLNDLVASAVDRVKALSVLPENARSQICRVLLGAGAVPELAGELRRLQREREAERRGDPFWSSWASPSRADAPDYLRNRATARRFRLEVASRYASDPGFSFPAEFMAEIREAALKFPAESRRLFLGHTAEEHTWEHLEPLLCRLLPNVLKDKALEFVRHVGLRSEEAVYPWLFAADDYVVLYGLPEVDAIARTWERYLNLEDDQSNHRRTTEFTLFGLLLPFMTPREQVEQLQRRGERPDMVSYESDFLQLHSEGEQRELAELAHSDEQLLPVLWYASAQDNPIPQVWLPLVSRAMRSSNSVLRGFALELLLDMPDDAVAAHLSQAAACVANGAASHLERHWATRLLLEYSNAAAGDVLATCDLAACAHVLGEVKSTRSRELAIAFAGHVLLWLNRQVDPSEPPIPGLKVTVQGRRDKERGYAAVSVDWSQIDSTVSMRSEMSSWGGLESGDLAGAFRENFSENRFDELQAALAQALDAASAGGNWAYAAFWSDSTLNLLIDQVPGFIENTSAVIEEAKNRRKLRSIGGFVAALARVLLKRGAPGGLKLVRLLDSQDVPVRQVDGLSGHDLFDLALFAFPRGTEAQHLWLERLDASTSDAYVFACCELLVQGGNEQWLVNQARQDLSSAAPYLRRRGLLLLAGSGCSRAELDAAAAQLGDAVAGIEDVLAVAGAYVERLKWMQKWTGEMLRAQEPLQAYCAAMLLLHCADNRVWDVIDAAVKQHGTPQSGAALWHLVPREEIKRAIKETLKERNKSLFGYKKADNDVAPWLASESLPTLRTTL